MRNLRTWYVIASLCASLLLMAAPAAFAQTASQEGYDGTGIVGTLDEPSGPSSGGGSGSQAVSVHEDPNGGGKLPFTGLELGIFALLGVTLAGTGYVLRRTLRSDAASS